MNDYLSHLENQSIYIIREAYKNFEDLAVLWSMGKDSTVVLWLIRKAFFGHCPFPVLHVDTTFKFPEMYAYREKYAKEWNLNLLVETNWDAINRGVNYDNCDALTCCHELKTEGLKQAIDKHSLRGLLLGIRSDEEGSRSKERFFSVRDKDFQWNYKDQAPELWDQFKTEFKKDDNLRVHPILHWREIDIWDYVHRENIPVNELYFAKDGKRYRSLGCMPITKPVDSDADTIPKIIDELRSTNTNERSGRKQDQEDTYALQKLRAKGYM